MSRRGPTDAARRRRPNEGILVIIGISGFSTRSDPCADNERTWRHRLHTFALFAFIGQIPLAIAGLVLLVSGPAVVLVWFKLRSRNLGPILDANGWTINSRARINIPFGTSLTQLATLPPGAERSPTDPYAEKATPWGTYLVIAVVVAAAPFWSLRNG